MIDDGPVENLVFETIHKNNMEFLLDYFVIEDERNP